MQQLLKSCIMEYDEIWTIRYTIPKVYDIAFDHRDIPSLCTRKYLPLPNITDYNDGDNWSMPIIKYKINIITYELT